MANSGMNMSQFDRTSRAAAKAVVAEATEAFRAVALSMYSDITTHVLASGGAFGTPVASGRMSASMRLEINRIDHTNEAADPDYVYGRPLPARTIRNRAISRVNAKLRTFKLGDSVFVSNSVPYVRRIEVAGHSWQAPEGAFAPTVRHTVRRFANLNLKVRYV